MIHGSVRLDFSCALMKVRLRAHIPLRFRLVRFLCHCSLHFAALSSWSLRQQGTVWNFANAPASRRHTINWNNKRLGFGPLHDSRRSFPNNIQHKLGLRQHGDMTAVGFEDRCAHALCDEALQLRLDSLVLGGYDVPAWLGSPCGSFSLLIEEIRCRRSMRCPDKFLLTLWQITRKGRNAVWFQPNTSVCHFNMREDVCSRKLFL